MTPFRRLLLASLPVFVPFCAAAQTDTQTTMPSTVITTDREPIPAEKVTGTVTVITRGEMERRQLRTVTEVLRSVPGISVQQSGGVGGQTSVFVRGSNSNHVVVLIDGITVNDPSTPNGAIDFAHFLTENLDRIEVVRGPMSTLYGSGAIGGVINMVTKKGSGAPTGGGYAEIGTRLQTSAGAYVRGSAGRFNYNISATGLYAQGERIVPFRRFTPSGRLRRPRRLSQQSTSVRDWASTSTTTRRSPGSAASSTVTSISISAVGQEDPNANEYTQQFFNRLQFDGNYFDGLWKPDGWAWATATVYRQTWTTRSVQVPANFFFSPVPEPTFGSGRTFTADWKNVIEVSELFNFVGGVDFNQQWAYTNTNVDHQFPLFNPLVENWGAASQTGLYGQLRSTLFNALTLSARRSHTDLARAGTGRSGLWRAGAAYLLSATDTRFKASTAPRLKAPALPSNSTAPASSARATPTCSPNTAAAIEFGVEQGMFNGSKVRGAITYFKNNLSKSRPSVRRRRSLLLQNVRNNAQTEGVGDVPADRFH